MQATAIKSPSTLTDKNKNEYYPTPSWCVRGLLQHCPPPKGLIVEPSAGSGSIVSELILGGYDARNIVAVEQDDRFGEILREYTNRVHVMDWFKFIEHFAVNEFKCQQSNLSVTANPPFSQALEFVESTLSITALDYAAFLLPLNFLASKKRAKFNTDHPVTRLLVLASRPSFTNDNKTAANDYAWFIWSKHHEACPPTIINK